MRRLSIAAAMLSLTACASRADQVTCDLSRDSCWNRIEMQERRDLRQRYHPRRVHQQRIYVPVPTPPRHHHHEDRDRRDYDERDIPVHHCAAPVSGLGAQWATEGGAKDAAADAWMARVRYQHGEHMMDLKHARRMEYACTRSSVGDFGGSTFHRCELLAVPCKAPLVRVDK